MQQNTVFYQLMVPDPIPFDANGMPRLAIVGNFPDLPTIGQHIAINKIGPHCVLACIAVLSNIPLQSSQTGTLNGQHKGK